MLRPVVSLALRFGLKYHDMDSLMRRLLLEEAHAALAQAKGRAPSASQLSVTTGIHRKEIRRFHEEGADDGTLPSSERSVAALVFALWLRRTARRSLPLQAGGRALSFEKLVLQTGKDVHFRPVLDELVRLGLMAERGDTVELLSADYVPHGAEAQMLALLADNVHAHLAAGVANVSGTEPPFLEQAVWATGFSPEQSEAAHDAARTAWSAARRDLLKALEEINSDEPPADAQRLRIGMYMHYEPIDKEGDPK
ncbi:MAG: hypothetical protein KGJ44_06465 [Betaproteobacteria bacterium]|nr:hypothetical protein [Betaproteobacteria bacterium]